MSLFGLEPGEDVHIPFDQAAQAAAEVLEEAGDASTVFQTFECSHCNTTQPTLEANAFHETGVCAECRKTTNLRETGCGFTVAVGDPEAVIQAVADKVIGKVTGEPA